MQLAGFHWVLPQCPAAKWHPEQMTRCHVSGGNTSGSKKWDARSFILPSNCHLSSNLIAIVIIKVTEFNAINRVPNSKSGGVYGRASGRSIGTGMTFHVGVVYTGRRGSEQGLRWWGGAINPNDLGGWRHTGNKD